jgi:hypothetical protein
MAAVRWKPDATTWEDYQERNDAVEQAVRREREIQEYRDRLQQGRERIESGRPMPTEELRDLELDIEDAPADVLNELSKSSALQKSAAHEILKDDPLPSAPDATANFGMAVAGTPAPAPQGTAPTPVIRRDA